VQAGLDDVEVLVEYQLPLTSKRADVVLCGVHPRTGQPSYVVVELKQWSSASLLEDSVDLCVVPAYGGARLHPGEQVRRYCGHLGDFLATLADLDDPLAAWRTCTTRPTSTCRSSSGCPRTSKGGCSPASGARSS
jgi:hypothetical protein